MRFLCPSLKGEAAFREYAEWVPGGVGCERPRAGRLLQRLDRLLPPKQDVGMAVPRDGGVCLCSGGRGQGGWGICRGLSQALNAWKDNSLWRDTFLHLRMRWEVTVGLLF